MKTRTLFIIIGIPIAAVFFIIGWTGVEVEGVLTEGQCEICYEYYYVEPVVKDAWQCHGPFFSVTPCGTDTRLVKHNAQVRLIQCLCENISENDSVIVNYYNNKFDRYMEHEIPSNDSEFICREGAKQVFRL